MRIAVADDSLLVREGLARLLDDLGHQVVFQAARADILPAEVAAHRPEIVIVDIKMPPTFSLIAEGLSDRGIAERLVVSLNTVGTHIQHIFTKLGLPDTAADNRRVRATLAWLQASAGSAQGGQRAAHGPAGSATVPEGHGNP